MSKYYSKTEIDSAVKNFKREIDEIFLSFYKDYAKSNIDLSYSVNNVNFQNIFNTKIKKYFLNIFINDKNTNTKKKIYVLVIKTKKHKNDNYTIKKYNNRVIIKALTFYLKNINSYNIKEDMFLFINRNRIKGKYNKDFSIIVTLILLIIGIIFGVLSGIERANWFNY